MNRMTENNQDNNRDIERPTVNVIKVFDAPVEDVWKAWYEPELIKQWWGPEGYSSPGAKIDFREGGRFIIAMKSPEGNIVWGSGVYQSIIPHKKIVNTDYFSDEQGNKISPDEAGMPGNWADELRVTITFKSIHPNKTEMWLSHEGIPKDMHDDCVNGWSSSFTKLQRLVAKH